MAMRPTHDLMVKTGSYTDRDGNPKNRWLKNGSRSSATMAARRSSSIACPPACPSGPAG